MNFFQRFYKVVSYLFIGFIVILITLTFGMPDFISSASDSDRYVAVKIGDEMLTRSQVARTQDNYIRQYFQGRDISPEIRKTLKDQILEQLIQNKVRLLLMKEIDLFPIARSRKRVMADYLKENFSTYFTDTYQDYEKFKQEILQRNRLSYSDLETNVVNEHITRYGHDLLSSVKLVSSPEKILRWAASETKLSYEVAVFDKATKDRVLKKRASVTQADIQKKFEKNYLAKDPNAKLTKIKKEAIRNSLVKEKEKSLNSELEQEMKNLASKNTVSRLASRYRIKFYRIQNVSLTESLDSKKPAGAPSLRDLENSKKFQEMLTFAKLNQTNIIFEKDNFFLVSITKKDQPKASKDYLEALQKKDATKLLADKQEKKLSSIEKETLGEYSSKMLDASVKLKKSDIVIKRFL